MGSSVVGSYLGPGHGSRWAGTRDSDPDFPRDIMILHDLVMWLAPHLRTVQTEDHDVADIVGQGPLMRPPVSLTPNDPEGVTVHFGYRGALLLFSASALE